MKTTYYCRSPAIQKTPEKLMDQHQHQKSSKTQAPPIATAAISQNLEVEQLLKSKY